MDIQFTFNPTVSINVTGDLTIAELTPGNALDSNIITVTAGSNEANGYTLYSTVGSSTNNYTDLRLSSSNTTNVFTNLSSNKTSLDDFDSNTWGYSYCLTANDCSDTTSTNPYWVSGSTGNTTTGYNGLPIYNASDNTTGVKLADTSTAAETELKFKIGAKAASTQASGTYTNTVSFIGVAKVVTTNYTLNYDANAGSDTATVTNMPANISNGTTNTSAITLSTTTPARENYTFKGWCTDNSSETSCNGTLYGPGRIYIFTNPGTTTTVNLYAIWEVPTITFDNVYAAANKPKTNGYYAMQDLSSAMCANVSEDQTSTLIDTRDNNTYIVAKLNGNCWMAQNLRITHSTGQPEGIILATDSNFSNKGSVTLTNGTSFNSYATPQYHTPTEIDLSQSGLTADQVGAWYSFCAASAADTANHGCDNSTSYSGSEDICPANWRLPNNTGDTTGGEMYDLKTALNANPTAKQAFNPVYGGRYNNGSLSRAATYGLWWSSTALNANNQYLLYYYGGSLATSNSYKYNGYYIRCIRSGA